MSTTTKRPVYLNLIQIRLPVPGLMSIGHRISGVALILSIPFLAGLLATSLSGPEGFAEAAATLDSGFAKLLLFLMGWGLFHHLLAGIRYLLLDVHIGIDKATANKTAWAVMIGGAILAVVIGGIIL